MQISIARLQRTTNELEYERDLRNTGPPATFSSKSATESVGDRLKPLHKESSTRDGTHRVDTSVHEVVVVPNVMDVVVVGDACDVDVASSVVKRVVVLL